VVFLGRDKLVVELSVGGIEVRVIDFGIDKVPHSFVKNVSSVEKLMTNNCIDRSYLCANQ